ncbi:hypothetical protein A9Q87_06225 [Flavobacteriales bacterium 34_180_T64]|nr:hypothetical protein A9Q87_06225 [Flavobacteriales bacterium 34_180_T64]
MKKAVYIFGLFLVFACNSEDVGDCFQTSGSIIQQEFSIDPFEKVLVNRDIELIVKEGAEFEVVVETGENLMNDVEVEVIGNELILTDHNSCNYVRDYGITKVYVTAPNLNSIRSSTQYDISSDGVLNFDNLELISEDFNAVGTFTVGDFRMQVNAINLRAVANNISSFYLIGHTENLYVGFFSGSGRFEGEALIAQNVAIYHRGTNDIFVNPQLSISGELRSTGNVISINEPPTVAVEEFYTGRLIFDD